MALTFLQPFRIVSPFFKEQKTKCHSEKYGYTIKKKACSVYSMPLLLYIQVLYSLQAVMVTSVIHCHI